METQSRHSFSVETGAYGSVKHEASSEVDKVGPTLAICYFSDDVLPIADIRGAAYSRICACMQVHSMIFEGSRLLGR